MDLLNTAGQVLFSFATQTMSVLVAEAIKAKADLRGADLGGANLGGANLRGADLGGADLRWANLRGANLRWADLRGADLGGADLGGANLGGANLGGANLRGANLRGADLRGANLGGANLRGADLGGADLGGAENAALAIAMTRILPDEGDVIGWKKCCDNVIVKLRIDHGVKRSHAFGRKCRSERAIVLDVIGSIEGRSGRAGDVSTERIVYRIGETVVCDAWNDDWTIECAGGIHFFITRAEAEAYVL